MEYRVTIKKPEPLITGHLHMGGEDPRGVKMEADSRRLLKGGQPWLPVMGEMHITRNPCEFWEEDILKMKAGGIHVISSYLFWIHHEEQEGEFCFSGSRDIRRFVRLCQKHDMYFFLRVGPWVHGECRNGGHPDWIYEKCEKTRCNDETYLFYVRRYFREIAKQMQGLFYRDGGPVIGIQLENELVRNPEHLLTLKKTAMECGMEAPYYTVTGWGYHGGTRFPQDEFIPMFGAYPEAPWEQHTQPLQPDIHYTFMEERNDTDIGTDVIKIPKDEDFGGEADWKRYPYATCETGGGIPISYHRRPVIAPPDLGAISITTMGSGCNFPGYFMFKGGCNPRRRTASYNESKETGYINNFPALCNDFQAPISEFGEYRESFGILKRLNLFLNDYGGDLSRMEVFFPETVPLTRDDTETLRFTVREGENGGFLFVNNYQRMTAMKDKEDVSILISRNEGAQMFDGFRFTVPDGAYFIFPYDRSMGGFCLEYATAQPVCCLRGEEQDVCLFFEIPGMEARLVWKKQEGMTYKGVGMEVREETGYLSALASRPGKECRLSLKAPGERPLTAIVLREEEANHCYKIKTNGKEKILLCRDDLYADREHVIIYGSEENGILWRLTEDGVFEPVTYRTGSHPLNVQVQAADEDETKTAEFNYLKTDRPGTYHAKQWSLSIDAEDAEEDDEMFLEIQYTGDVAHLYLGDRLIADDFWKGTPWRIGLRRFFPGWTRGELTLSILPAGSPGSIYLECQEAEEGAALLHSVKAEVKKRVTV